MAINIPGQQELANPVGSFLQGRAIQRAEVQQAQQSEMAKEQLAGAQQARKQSAVEFAQQQEIAVNKQNYLVAQAAANSDDPAALIRQVKPEFITDWDSHHGEGHFDSLNSDDLKKVAKHMQSEFGAKAGIAPPAPQSKEGKIVADVKTGFLTKEEGDTALNPKKNTPDFDNFLASQKDPEFRKFLQEKRGKGLKITTPDGTIIDMGGEGSKVDSSDLTNPVITKLQTSIVDSTNDLDALNSVRKNFDPKFLTIPGRFKGGALKIKDMAGGMLGELTPEETDFLKNFSTFKANASKNLSAILNRLSGAAISPAEGERLKKGIANDEDSPTEFMAKYDASVRDLTRGVMRANWALKNGIGVKSVEQLSAAMPLDQIDGVYKSRANEIWQGMGGKPETKQKAIEQANKEFGVAR